MDNKKPTINWIKKGLTFGIWMFIFHFFVFQYHKNIPNKYTFEKGIKTFIFWICSGLMFGYLDYHIQKWFANTNKIQ